MDCTHFDIATYPVKDTIKLLTALLVKITETNDQLHREAGTKQPSAYTCFHARSIPTITIHAYLTRILKYCPCANECLIALLVYFDRMTQPQLNPLHIDSYNIHRLIITGLMISSKLYSDVFFTNTRYAKVGGLPVAELNALELEFLRLNDYNLFVDIDKLQKYGDNVLEHWNQVQDLETLSIRNNANLPTEDIIRPFSRLTMRTADSDHHPTQYKSASNESSSPTTPITPTADSMDKQWRCGSQQSFSLKSGNNETIATPTSKETLRRL